jgi:hypothetical protein
MELTIKPHSVGKDGTSLTGVTVVQSEVVYIYIIGRSMQGKYLD